jgi:hypothetical protein
MPTTEPEAPRKKQAVLIASGDLRLPANRQCWPAQRDMEKKLVAAIRKVGWTVRRAHPYKKEERHGFIASQKEGMDIFRTIHPDSPLIVAESAWQFSHHVLPGMMTHRGPILTVANWSGQWPGLVGMLNLNGSMTKAGVDYSTLWSKNFTDSFFRRKLGRWLQTGKVSHDTSHVRSLETLELPDASAELGASLADAFKTRKAIMGVFDEGCMGMFNAIIPDHLLNPTGLFKERLSQSALWAEMGKGVGRIFEPAPLLDSTTFDQCSSKPAPASEGGTFAHFSCPEKSGLADQGVAETWGVGKRFLLFLTSRKKRPNFRLQYPITLAAIGAIHQSHPILERRQSTTQLA